MVMQKDKEKILNNVEVSLDQRFTDEDKHIKIEITTLKIESELPTAQLTFWKGDANWVIDIEELGELIKNKDSLYSRAVIEQAVMDGINRFRQRIDAMANQDVTTILEFSVSDLIEAAVKQIGEES